MVVAIHQPNFIPWIGYFYKISQVDTFVFLDDVQFSKNSYTNRNLIKTPNGSSWLTLPIVQNNKFGQNINAVEIFEFEKNRDKCLKTIELNYKKANNFKMYFDDLISCFNTNMLAQLNINIIEMVCTKLDIKTIFKKSSELSISSDNPTTRLIEICKALNGTKYISGFGGNNYQDVNMFVEHKIALESYSFSHPTYNQLWKQDFETNLSILDFIFNADMELITNTFKKTN
jgi:hypothetical protein